MPVLTLNLIKGDKTSTETDYRDALPVNAYGVIRNILGAEGYMLCYPGLTQYATGSGKDRGGNYNDRFDFHYRVSGEFLIRIGTDGTLTQINGSLTGSEQVSMPYSFNTQGIIAGGKFYLTDSTVGFREVTNPFGLIIDGVWVDQYYFMTDGDDLFHTSITDEDTIDLLAFKGSDFSPDKIKGLLLTQDNKVLVLNRYSVEYFINVATDNFAFQRQADRAQKIGIVATHAKCEASGVVYIAGGRKMDSVGVHILGLGSSKKISTREIDKILATYTEPALSDMRMESRMQGDVSFVLVHLPNETLCFNETIAKKFGVDIAWSILKSDVAGNTPYRGINGVFDPNRGQWVYGDKQDTRIGYLDNTVFTHYEAMVEGILYTPLINLESMSIDKIDIDTIPGHTGSEDANVAISFTENGLTYGKEQFMQYGDPAEYGKNFIIRRPSGYIRKDIGVKLRFASTSRMAFADLKLTYS